jgi:hypothetical protein
MAKLVETDEHVTFARQMEKQDISGPIILINRFAVNPEDVDFCHRSRILVHQ